MCVCYVCGVCVCIYPSVPPESTLLACSVPSAVLNVKPGDALAVTLNIAVRSIFIRRRNKQLSLSYSLSLRLRPGSGPRARAGSCWCSTAPSPRWPCLPSPEARSSPSSVWRRFITLPASAEMFLWPSRIMSFKPRQRVSRCRRPGQRGGRRRV